MLWFHLHHNIQWERPNFYDEQSLEVVPACSILSLPKLTENNAGFSLLLN